ncbi:MAG: hypothetical protein AAF449_11390 [Myxococcota bacterium]
MWTLIALSPEARAGAWTLEHGQLWIKQSVSYWQTTERFANTDDRVLNFPGQRPVQPGDRIPFDPTTGGSFEALSSTTEAQIGLFDRLQLGLRVPLLYADFSETESPDTVDASFGLGDLWLSAQGSLPMGPFVMASRIDLKLPIGDFEASIFAAPLTEGQIDINVAALVGISLHPYGYVNGEIGWRVLFENPDNQRDPGDELRFALEAGLFLPADFMFKVLLDGVVGFEGTDRFANLATTLPRRRLYSMWLGMIWSPTERLSIEGDIRWLVAGEDFPTGIQTWLGVSYLFDVIDTSSGR